MGFYKFSVSSTTKMRNHYCFVKTNISFKIQLGKEDVCPKKAFIEVFIGELWLFFMRQ